MATNVIGLLMTIASDHGRTALDKHYWGGNYFCIRMFKGVFRFRPGASYG